MIQAAELLGRRSTSDIDCAVSIISEGLMISSYSEKLLQMKADALLKVHINVERKWYIILEILILSSIIDMHFSYLVFSYSTNS